MSVAVKGKSEADVYWPDIMMLQAQALNHSIQVLDVSFRF